MLLQLSGTQHVGTVEDVTYFLAQVDLPQTLSMRMKMAGLNQPGANHPGFAWAPRERGDGAALHHGTPQSRLKLSKAGRWRPQAPPPHLGLWAVKIA